MFPDGKSASTSKTLSSCFPRARLRFVDTKVLPTPPFPDTTDNLVIFKPPTSQNFKASR